MKNDFCKCGFLKESYTINKQLKPNPEEYDIVRVLINMLFKHLDSNVYSYDQNENIYDILIQSIRDKHNSDENTGEKPDPFRFHRLREAKKSLETLKIFFLHQGNEPSSKSALDAYSNYIGQQLIISKKQTTIDIFFFK